MAALPLIAPRRNPTLRSPSLPEPKRALCRAYYDTQQTDGNIVNAPRGCAADSSRACLSTNTPRLHSRAKHSERGASLAVIQ